MQTFQKVVTVDARQYSGPPLTVVSDQFGEQVASEGDYLVGTERGKVTVISKAVFEAEYVEHTATSDEEAMQVATQKLESLTSELATAQASLVAAGEQIGTLTASNAELIKQSGNAVALKAQVETLTGELSAANAAKDDLQARFDKLTAAEKQAADAQKQLDAAQSTVSDAISK